MTTTRQKEAALLRAYQALVAARHALEPMVASMVGKTLRNRKTGKLYKVVGNGDAWHMMTVVEVTGYPISNLTPHWMANPSEFTIVGELEKIPEETHGKFDDNPPEPRIRARRARQE